MNRLTLLALAFGGFTSVGVLADAKSAIPDKTLPSKVEFNRDIRPILSDNCYFCHGPDKNHRKADVRLDTEEGAFADYDGHKLIVPGKPEESELFLRITEDTETGRMPPKKSGKHLSKKEIDLIRRWIEQGAKWQKHWSYIVPQRPSLSRDPGAPGGAWPRNAIDHFILARLEQEGLKPSPEADRRTLIRRLSFDLLGLPPNPEEVDAFIADKSPNAYEKLVDRLLASPHYGERMAVFWLDLVRFADTIGYHTDNPRNIAPYRDYVIAAFNANKAFDQFTIEQLGGDLLPNAGVSEKVASGYNRLLQTTEEGGAQPKEYRAKYAADRVRNVSAVWMGLTMGCCECHDHKFDQLSTRDFYRFAAFFADIQEAAVGNFQNPDKGMLVPRPEQAAQLKRLEQRQKAIKAAMQKPKLEVTAAAMLSRVPSPLLDSRLRQWMATQHNYNQLVSQIPRSQIAMSGPPREMRVLPRGNWLDDSGEEVTPEIPSALGSLATDQRKLNRLDLGRWLVARNNPLTARVTVNRLWKLFFGNGLCRSMEDFGAQGQSPTHPELLDWLAVEFMESGWDVKHMVKLMLTSSAYRQRSEAGKELKERDPENRLLTRQARFRHDAEFVRDNALAISGLLVHQLGGNSVKPYQPEGYWAYLNFPVRTYEHDHGPNQYRRGLYTHWQRTFLHPSLVAFDAPSREECTAERARSNIPQQALVLLNDPTYVEASRAFAARIMKEGGSTTKDRLTWAYRQALSRPPKAEELPVLLELYEKHQRQYVGDKYAAEKLVKVGESPAPKELNVIELAAWTSVARVILNLHEVITRN